MMKNTDTITKLLNKYKLTSPIDRSVRKRIISSRKAVLTDIYKINGDYSFFYNASVSLNAVFRNIGVRLTISQSRILYILISSLTVLILSILIYFAYFKFFNSVHVEIPEKSQQVKISENEFNMRKKSNKNIAKDGLLKISYRIGITPIESVGLNDIESNIITDYMARELSILLGNKSIIKTDGFRNKNFNLLLTGAISKFDDSSIFTIRLIDVQTSEIVFIGSEKDIIQNNLDEKCKSLSKQIKKYIIKSGK